MATEEHAKYRPARFEPKWQKFWVSNETFKAEDESDKPKLYVLDMFPYPSGAGLHVGHPEGYTATDIWCRYKRMRGYNVLHPMGWDAFGLPAEQYAVETGTRPAETTAGNIINFKRQIQSLGFSYDWSREVNTTDPKYYRWTQWIFLQLYKKGLAYLDEIAVNWCPELGTVLANEEVIDGRSERGNHPVVKRPMKQWILRITEYAERLLNDLDDLDWPEGIKEMQRNWIGKSTGAEVDFKVVDRSDVIRVYTTRPDTLFGATYMVLAPEHPLVAQITADEQRSAVETYVEASSRKSDLDRTELNTEKSGVFIGAHATNPVNGEAIPIWISDYVLITYGTGAIMSVPAHDMRDFEFAEKFGIEIRCILEPEAAALAAADLDVADLLAGKACWTGDGKSIRSANDHGLDINGLDVVTAKQTTIDWLEAEGIGKATVNYKLRDWLFSRQRYWGEPFPLVHMEDGEIRLLDESELPLELPEIEDFKPSGSGESPLAKAGDWLNYTDPETGQKGRRETHTMPQWAGSCWYYLRYIDPCNDTAAWSPEKEKYWMPVDLYVGGAEHAVLHLLYARFWHKVLFDLGHVSSKEPFQRLINQGMILGLGYRDARGVPVANDQVEDRDHKYFHKNTGEELEQFPAKMSKALKNVVNPDDIVGAYGADTLRLYEMFVAPPEKEIEWSDSGLEGSFRFLTRVWRLVTALAPVLVGAPRGVLATTTLNEGEDGAGDDTGHRALRRKTHATIRRVSSDLDPRVHLNTAVSALMELVNDLYAFCERQGLAPHGGQDPPAQVPVATTAVLAEAVEALVLMLSPFTPHLCEELWERLGHDGGLVTEPWPRFDPAVARADEIVVPVQVNGKLRARLQVEAGVTEEALRAAALAEPGVRTYTEGKTIKRVVVVPGKLVNIVVT